MVGSISRHIPYVRTCQWPGIVKPFLLADIGEGITEVQLIQWFVQPGARVEQFDKLCEVQSDKASVEITSPFDGVIKKLHYDQDDVAKTGKPLVDIDIEGDISDSDAKNLGGDSSGGESANSSFDSSDAEESVREQQIEAEGVTQEDVAEPSVTAKSSDTQTASTQRDGQQQWDKRTLATPAVRHLTKELKVDIADIKGTGKDGRVLKEDVHRHANEQKQPQAPQQTKSISTHEDRRVPLSPVQNQMFKTMTKSLNIPHFLYSCTANMGNITSLRKTLNASATSKEQKLTHLPFVLKAVSLAFQHHPLLNASLHTQDPKKPELTYRGSHNFGVAVDTPSGLLVPVVKNVQDLSIVEISQQLKQLSEKARSGKLAPGDFSGGSFTVSNIGNIGGGVVSPVISEPQVGILGVGRSKLVPAFDENEVLIRREEKHYEKGSADREKLAAAMKSLRQRSPLEVPIVVNGKETKTANVSQQPFPMSHKDSIASWSSASASDVSASIDSALKAKASWESLPFADRAAVFLKAADLVSGKYRYDIMAATMLGQGKNAWQAEIDSAAELCDFFRFNVKYAQELYGHQPVHNSPGVWNRVEYRPLEGFVYAITPFNFTAIAGNLPAAPALMGNVVVWKPSPSAMASNWLVYQILLEAGLPKDVIQFVPGDAVEVTKTVLSHKQFAALHYTGSTAVFRSLYGQIANNVAEGKYQGYPRIIGETGGKNFHLIHHSANVENAVINTVRGAFEYQGQKCSATSRAYWPKSLWDQAKPMLIEETQKLKIGSPESFDNFIGPVIHKGSFDKLSGAIDEAKNDSELDCIVGGKYDGSEGYFIHPTIYETKNPMHPNMQKEFFGPILTVYVYDDTKNPEQAYHDICKTIDETSDYALTGAIFAQDRMALRTAEENLRNSAGNFYLNCKSTGAVVGQQPFGGARASGTNDKAGSTNLQSRFVSMRAIKEQFVNDTSVLYPSNIVHLYSVGIAFHTAENVKKMREGTPLTDADRWDWLILLREEALKTLAASPDLEGVVVTCSALKRKYRDVFRLATYHNPDVLVHFVFLNASESLLMDRVRARQNHYMKDYMVRSQFESLEAPQKDETDVLSVEASGTSVEVQELALAVVNKVVDSDAGIA
ncbi:hypothetical protein BTJ68_02701 [Hortaea werneckii EXF-2000]|uniref:Lipoamide acyltransferase component of branched-chain alpha-keto acid dehydrogenase complex, mitochondrial n=1 Tax=Hortaea werneckii EXF-2000 TaxID=1157616 RepID=A0A1Z5TMS3_HORWE|nr:hypothetical protein BTJ68_02701 [Hortaea werneckii EXF-2000]